MWKRITVRSDDPEDHQEQTFNDQAVHDWVRRTHARPRMLDEIIVELPDLIVCQTLGFDGGDVEAVYIFYREA